MHNKDMGRALAVALAYHNAWTSHRFEDARCLISDSASFETPINEYPSPGEFMQAVAYTASEATDIRMLATLGNDHQAVLLYDFRFGPIGNIRIAEQFDVADGKIVCIRHIHDTSAIRKTFSNEK